MLENFRTIILRTVKYGDSQLIVDMLSHDYGRTTAVWRMPRSGRGKTPRNVFQPLTICDITIERTRATRLPLIKDAHIAVPYTSLNVDPVKVSVAFFLAEFLCQASQAEQADASLYNFTESSLTWYDLATTQTANFHLMFLVRISQFLGFYPNMDSFSSGAFFDLRAAEFCASAPLHRDFIQPHEAARIGTLMKMTASNMHLFRFSRAQRTRAIEIMLQFYSIHVPGFKEMKSWEVLRTIFD